jgi:micrococcal nuclease
MKWVALLGCAALGLVLAAPASGAVRKVAFTAVVSPNDYAELTVKVSPKARCSITVKYDTVISSAKGLGKKTGGTITWRWKVGSTTNPGRWPVTVDCGKSGKLSLRLRVLRN